MPRIFAGIQASDSNSSVVHWDQNLNQLTKITYGDVTAQQRYATQIQVVAIDPSAPTTTGFYVFKFLHMYNNLYTEWQVQKLDNSLVQATGGDFYRQRTTYYQFKYLATRFKDGDNWEAVGLDLLTNKVFYISGILSTWKLTVYPMPSDSQNIKSAFILPSGRIFYAGSATYVQTYNHCVVSPFASVSSYQQINPSTGTFSNTVAFLAEYSRAAGLKSCVRFAQDPVFNCDNTCTGSQQIVLGDNAGAVFTLSTAADFTLAVTPLSLSSTKMTSPGSWVATQDRSWCVVKSSSASFTLTAPIFDSDDLFSVILEQSSPIAFADWTLNHASFASCLDGAPSYQIQVKKVANVSTDLNAMITSNPVGNTLTWDKLNDVPVAANPNVITMSSSSQAILSNIYTVTVFMQLANYQCATKAFTVNIKQACRFTTLTAKWDSNGTSTLATTYKIGSTAQTFAYSTTKDFSYCDIEEQIQHFDGSSWLAYTGSLVQISPTGTFKVYTTDLSLDNSLVPPTQKFRVQFGSPNLSTANTKVMINVDVTWQHPCRYAVITTQTIPNMQNQVDQANKIYTVPAFVHSDSPTDCGAQVLTVISCTPSCTVANFLTITGFQLSVGTLNDGDVGVYDVTLQVQFVSYPAITLSLSPFKVTITPSCRTDSFSNFLWSTTSSDSLAIDHKIGGTLDSGFTQASNTLSAECNIRYSLFLFNTATSQYESITTDPNFSLQGVTPPSSLRVSSTTADFGKDQQLYKLRLTIASVTDLLTAQDPAHIYLEVKFVHPCRYAVITTQTIPNMQNQVDQANKIYTAPAFIHSESPTDCGAQVLTVTSCTPSCTVTNFLKITGFQLSVGTLNDGDAGVYDVTLQVQFVSYPAITLSLSPFKVTITPSCRTDSFSNFLWSATSSDSLAIDHKIGGTLDSGFTQASNTLSAECTIRYSLFLFNTATSQYDSLTTSPLFSLQTVALPTLLRVSSTTADFGKDQQVYKLRITIASVTDLSTAQHPAHIYLEVKFVHPCWYSTMTISDLYNLQTTVLGGLMTQKAPGIYHTFQTDPVINCGSISFEYSSAQIASFWDKSSLAIQTANGDLLVEATSKEQIGAYQIKLKVWLTAYPSVSQTSPYFQLQVLPCEVKELVPQSNIPAVQYVISMRQQTMTFKEYTQIPNCEYKLTYTLVDKQTDQVLDSSTGISLSPNEPRKIIVYTTDNKTSGSRSVRVVASLDYPQAFKSVKPIEFQVDMIRLPTFPNNAPSFVDPHEELIYYIGDKRIDLPAIFDQEGDKVTVTADLNLAASLFSYDSKKNVLEPIKSIKDEGRYFTSFELQDNHRDDPRNRVYFFNLIVKNRLVYQEPESPTKAFAGKRPVPSIVKITQTGEVHVKWSKQMYRDLNVMNETAVEEFGEWCQYVNEVDGLPGLDVRVKTDEQVDRNKTLLNLTWSFHAHKKAIPGDFYLHLKFEHPEEISSQNQPDFLELLFFNETLFNDTEGITVEKQTIISHLLPQILAYNKASQALKAIGRAVQTAVVGASVVSVIVNWVVGSSLSMVWNMINSLQIVAHFPLLNIIFPGNILSLFQIFTSISKFDLIPFEPLVIRMFKIDENEGAYNFELERMDYNYKTAFANMSATFVIYSIMAVGMVVHAVLSRFGGQNQYVRKVVKWLHESTYKSALLMIAESSLEASIASFVDIQIFIDSAKSWAGRGRSLAALGYTPTKWLSLLFSFTMIGTFIVYLWQLFFVVWRNFQRFQEDKTFASHWRGALEDIRLKAKDELLFPFFFISRRILLGVLSIWGNNYTFQYMSLFYLSTVILIFIGLQRPFKTKARNRNELFNEVFIIIIMYHFFIFTDFVPDSMAKYKMGYSCCVLLLVNIVGNLTPLIWDSLQKFLNYLRQQRMRKMRQKLQQLRNKPAAPKQTALQSHTDSQLVPVVIVQVPLETMQRSVPLKIDIHSKPLTVQQTSRIANVKQQLDSISSIEEEPHEKRQLDLISSIEEEPSVQEINGKQLSKELLDIEASEGKSKRPNLLERQRYDTHNNDIYLGHLYAINRERYDLDF